MKMNKNGNCKLTFHGMPPRRRISLDFNKNSKNKVIK